MKRYLLTLVALLAMTTGAWADGFDVKQISVPESWNGDETTVTTADLPGFKAVSLNEAEAWTGAPASGIAYLFYAFDGNEVAFCSFKDGQYLSGGSYAYPHKEIYSDESQAAFFYTYADPNAILLTYDKDNKGNILGASFDMPAFDATADYELVRDLGESVNFLGIPTGNGATLKKDGDKYTFATAPIITLSDVLNPSEAISIFYYNDGFSYVESGLTLSVYPMVEIMEGYWKADETATPVALTDFLASPQPGRWKIKATATTGLYDGTLYSPEFTLAEAYDLTLSPATDANLKSVTVAGTAKTADENGVIRGIEPTKKVKITTTGPDYIIRKATVKKTPKANE